MATESRSEASPKGGAGPAVEADGLADLVEVLLPGGGVWPSGKAVGIPRPNRKEVATRIS